MESTLIKIVIYNYIVNHNDNIKYKFINDKIINYLEEHPDLKNGNDIKKYLKFARNHINTIIKIIDNRNIDLKKYDGLMEEINTLNDTEDIEFNINDFLQNIIDLNCEKNKNLYFIKNNVSVDNLRESMMLEIDMHNL